MDLRKCMSVGNLMKKEMKLTGLDWNSSCIDGRGVAGAVESREKERGRWMPDEAGGNMRGLRFRKAMMCCCGP